MDSTRQAVSRTRPDTWDTRAGNRAGRRFCRCILCSRRTTDRRRSARVAHLPAKENNKCSHSLFFLRVDVLLQLRQDLHSLGALICLQGHDKYKRRLHDRARGHIQIAHSRSPELCVLFAVAPLIYWYCAPRCSFPPSAFLLSLSLAKDNGNYRFYIISHQRWAGQRGLFYWFSWQVFQVHHWPGLIWCHSARRVWAW